MSRDRQEKVTIPEAAERLGISQSAVRQRIRRGSILWEKDETGRTYVYITPGVTSHHAVEDTSRDELIEVLREQLAAEREANREMRRLLAGLIERVPELEAPRETPGGPQMPAEETERAEPQDRPAEAQEATERRSWWRRWFGSD